MLSGPWVCVLTHILFLCNLEVCRVTVSWCEGGRLTFRVPMQSAEGSQEDVWREDACEDDW